MLIHELVIITLLLQFLFVTSGRSVMYLVMSYHCIDVLLLLTELSSPIIHDSLKCLLATLEHISTVTFGDHMPDRR